MKLKIIALAMTTLVVMQACQEKKMARTHYTMLPEWFGCEKQRWSMALGKRTAIKLRSDGVPRDKANINHECIGSHIWHTGLHRMPYILPNQPDFLPICASKMVDRVTTTVV